MPNNSLLIIVPTNLQYSLYCVPNLEFISYKTTAIEKDRKNGILGDFLRSLTARVLWLGELVK